MVDFFWEAGGTGGTIPFGGGATEPGTGNIYTAAFLKLVSIFMCNIFGCDHYIIIFRPIVTRAVKFLNIGGKHHL
jgi:hypothetical protein